MSVFSAVLGTYRRVLLEVQDPVSGPISLELDASLEENHVADSEITSYPVEEGPNVADNSRPRPKSLTIRFVQSSPVLDIRAATQNTGKFDSDVRRGEDLFEQIVEWKDAAALFTITTTLFVYSDMLVESITVPRTAQTADGIVATVKFVQVFVATSATVAAPVAAQPKAAPKAAVGEKPPAPVNDSSMGVKIGQGIGVLK